MFSDGLKAAVAAVAGHAVHPLADILGVPEGINDNRFRRAAMLLSRSVGKEAVSQVSASGPHVCNLACSAFATLPVTSDALSSPLPESRTRAARSDS